jgi:hypothetical protein
MRSSGIKRVANHGRSRWQGNVSRKSIAAHKSSILQRRSGAAYHGSWNHPDNKFAGAVAMSAANGDAPNFDMTDNTDIGSGELVPEALVADDHASASSPRAPDDQQQGWSSALFPTRSKPFGHVSTSAGSSSPNADRPQESSKLSAHPRTQRMRDDGLFRAQIA